MQKPITAQIDVTKIVKAHLYAGQKGTYLNVAIWPNKNGPDQRGNTHYIVQKISKEARDAGERGPIIGNLKMPDEEQEQPRRTPSRRPPGPLAPSAPPSRPRPPSDPDLDPADEDTIPF